MISRLFILLSALLLIASSGCNNDPVFSVVPAIEFVDIQPREVKQFTDSMVVTIRFTDGDGDLGDQGVEKNMIIVDQRSTLTPEQATLEYTVPNLTPDARNPSIQGLIYIEVAPTAITPGRNIPSEQTSFSIRLFDRAGHASNVVLTDEITILK
jgi:hypothetical protein